ncbi:ankyrin repeat protein [Aspergillus germanicus]
MTRLTSLPAELLLLIAKYIHNEKDLVSFTYTTERTCAVLQTYLYRTHIYYHGTWALLWGPEHGRTNLITNLLTAGASIGGFDDWSSGYHHNPGGGFRRVGNPLALAAKGNNVETLRVLLGEKRAGQAANPAQLRAVEMLIQSGASLCAVHGFRSYPSALSGAVLAGFSDIIPYLLEVCVEPRGPHGDSETPTPLEHAIKANQPDIVRILLDAGHRLVSDGGLSVIAAQGNKVLMDMFLDRGFDVEMCWQGALFAAVMHGQVDMVELLTARGANPHLTHEVWMWTFEICRYSTVGFAVQFRHLETLKLLLQKGVIPETRDLQLASDERFGDAVALLETYSDMDQTPPGTSRILAS